MKMDSREIARLPDWFLNVAKMFFQIRYNLRWFHWIWRLCVRFANRFRYKIFKYLWNRRTQAFCWRQTLFYQSFLVRHLVCDYQAPIMPIIDKGVGFFRWCSCWHRAPTEDIRSRSEKLVNYLFSLCHVEFQGTPDWKRLENGKETSSNIWDGIFEICVVWKSVWKYFTRLISELWSSKND